MLDKLSTLIELLGLLVIAVAIGALAGFWWGVLTAGVLLVVLGIALDRPATTPGNG